MVIQNRERNNLEVRIHCTDSGVRVFAGSTRREEETPSGGNQASKQTGGRLNRNQLDWTTLDYGTGSGAVLDFGASCLGVVCFGEVVKRRPRGNWTSRRQDVMLIGDGKDEGPQRIRDRMDGFGVDEPNGEQEMNDSTADRDGDCPLECKRDT